MSIVKKFASAMEIATVLGLVNHDFEEAVRHPKKETFGFPYFRDFSATVKVDDMPHGIAPDLWSLTPYRPFPFHPPICSYVSPALYASLDQSCDLVLNLFVR